MIGPSLYNLLSNYTALTDIIGTKIYPVEAPQRVESPALIYGITKQEPQDNKHTTSPEDWIEVDVLVYSKDYDQMHAISKEVRNALDGQKGTISGVAISQIRFLGFSDGWQTEREEYSGVSTYQVIAAP